MTSDRELGMNTLAVVLAGIALVGALDVPLVDYAGKKIKKVPSIINRRKSKNKYNTNET